MPQPPFVTRIFFSSSEPRLRAGWRLLIQTVLFLALIACITLPMVLPIILFGLSTDSIAETLLAEVAELFAITLSVFLARRFLDKRSFGSLGFKLDWCALLDLLTGLIITFFMMGGIYLSMSLLGWVKFNGFAWQSEALYSTLIYASLMLFIFILVGWNEELLSRGYHLQTLASGLNSFWGLMLSSAFFAIFHLANPHAAWFSTLGIFLAGLFLAYGYLRTNQLWLPIGLHIGWNFSEGVVFGFPVSGMNFFALTRSSIAGPVLWTGGLFGPEAGLILIPALILGAFAIYLYSIFRNKFFHNLPSNLSNLDACKHYSL